MERRPPDEGKVDEEMQAGKQGGLSKQDDLARESNRTVLRKGSDTFSQSFSDLIRGVSSPVMLARTKKPSVAFSLSNFPEDLRDTLRVLDLDNNGYIESSEVAAAATALDQSRHQNNFLRRMIVVLIVFLVLFAGTIFGLTYTVVELTKEVSVSDEDPVMRVHGTDTAVLVGSTDFVILEDGSMVPRDAADSLVISATPVSYAFLPDLVGMPLEVINSVSTLSFVTVDGAAHSLRISGVLLMRGADTMSNSLAFYAEIDDLSVFIAGDGTAMLQSKSEADRRIVLPTPEEANARRRALLESDKGTNLSSRCHPTTGKCLFTLHEIMHLHGVVDGVSGRRLQGVSSQANGNAFAVVDIDARTANVNTGFVTWDEEVDSDVAVPPAADAELDDGEQLIFDEHGCIVERGFDVVGYPLTVKHCFKFIHTSSCAFDLDGSSTDNGYTISASDLSALYEEDENQSCDTPMKESARGYCECGSGYKIRAGACSSGVVSGDFKCVDLCRDDAFANDQTTIDLFGAEGERLTRRLSLPEEVTTDLFRLNNRNGSFDVEVEDNVYYSFRLAYRRETPRFFGQDDYPAWLDWDEHVAAHYTSTSLADNGLTWHDVSGKGRDAHVTGTALEKVLLKEGTGLENDTIIVRGASSSSIDFDDAIFPTPVFLQQTRANFKDCEARDDCISLATAVRSTLSAIGINDTSFGAWYEAGGVDERPDHDTYVTTCQKVAASDARCGRYFDVFAPDFAALKAGFDAAFSSLLDGIFLDPPSFREGSGFDDYEPCAQLGQECTCEGEMRFALSSANNLTRHDDHFRVTNENADYRDLPGFDGLWAVGAPDTFQGEVAHYYAASGTYSCSADSLLNENITLEYNELGRAAYNVSNWDCYCRDHPRHVAEAEQELLGAVLKHQVLFEDWATLRPFAPATSSVFTDDRALSEFGGDGIPLVNPLHELRQSGFGAAPALEDGVEATCRCLEDYGEAFFQLGDGLVTTGEEALSVCAAKGLRGAVPESPAESKEAMDACGPDSLLSIGYDATTEKLRDLNSNGVLVFDAFADVGLTSPSGYTCTEDRSLCVREESHPEAPASAAIMQCASEGAHVCLIEDYAQLCGAGIDPYQGISGEWLGNHGFLNNWDDEYFVTGTSSCQGVEKLAGVDHHVAQRRYKCCRQGRLANGFTGSCPQSLQTSSQDSFNPPMQTANGEVCASSVLPAQTMHGAIVTCRDKGAHVCRHDELMQLCGVGNPFAGFTSGWYGNNAGPTWDNHHGVWNRDFCGGGNNDGPVEHAGNVHFFRCCSSSDEVVTANEQITPECPPDYERIGGLCLHRPPQNELKKFRPAQEYCMERGGSICSHVEMQEMCGYGVNVYDNQSPGWYSDREADDTYLTWNRGFCDSNNDGKGFHKDDPLSATWRCCRPASVPATFPPPNHAALVAPEGAMVLTPADFTCNADKSICFKRFATSVAAFQAFDTCKSHGARMCTGDDFVRLCSEDILAFQSGDWMGDRGFADGTSDDRYFKTNRDTCSANIDGIAFASVSAGPFACCKAGDLAERAKPTCPSGLRDGQTPNGEVCMSEMKPAAHATVAMATCSSLEGHVCRMHDMFQLCSAGYNPYSGISLGWYGDHGKAAGGDFDDEYAFWNNGFCRANNDGPGLVSTSANLPYRCCGRARGYKAVEAIEKACPEGYTQAGSLCFLDSGESLKAQDAINYCANSGGRVCRHVDMQEICGYGMNPYNGDSIGWYGQADQSNMYGTWNRAVCTANGDNDGSARSASSSPLPFRCCRDAGIPDLSATEGVVVLQDGPLWSISETVAPSPACCEGYDVTQSDIVLSRDELIEADFDGGGIYALQTDDPRSFTERKGLYTTMFHIARYGEDEGVPKKRIFQNTRSPDWFDGFDGGMSGVANHFNDFSTVAVDRHADQWVLSTSAECIYRSNFQTRPSECLPSGGNLVGLDLAVNPTPAEASAFDIAEILVLTTPYPLDETQMEDMERLLFKKHLPLFIRGHYPVDSLADDLQTDSPDPTIWKDSGLYGRDAAWEDQNGYTLKDNDISGFSVQVTGGNRLSFPRGTLPQDTEEYTVMAVTFSESNQDVLRTEDDAELQSCFSTMTTSAWKAAGCEKQGPRVTIQSTVEDAALLLCEVEVFASSDSSAPNLALEQPTTVSSTAGVSSPGLAVDGDSSTCARSLASGTQVFELLLSASDAIDRIVIHAGAGSSAFSVLVDGVEVGRTVQSLGQGTSQNLVPAYLAGQGPFTFFGDGASLGHSIWIKKPASSGAYLEICEIEVYAEPSTYTPGGVKNPSISSRSFATSDALATGSQPASALLDGNYLTCVKTLEGAEGLLRIDLPRGALPTSVNVFTRAGPSTCEEQALALEGAQVFVGDTIDLYEEASVPLVSKCGVASHVRTTQRDVAETTLVVDVGAGLTICEVELFVVGFNGTSVPYDLTARASYTDEATLAGAQVAKALTDGSTVCTAANALADSVLHISIDPSVIPARVVLHYETDIAPESVGQTTASLSHGIALGDFPALSASSGEVMLEISEATRDAVSSFITFEKDNVRSEVDSGCGVGSPKEAAGVAFAVLPSSTPCACSAACEADSQCVAWKYNRNAGHPNYRRCFLSESEVELSAKEALDFIGGVKASTPPASAEGLDLFLESSAEYEVADLVVFDGHFPGQLVADFQEYFDEQYLYLLSDGQELAAPIVNLRETFTVEGGGVQWASGVPVTWEQDPANHDTLTDELRAELGLHPLAHALSGLDTYLVSDNLKPPCLVASSNSEYVSLWGLDPVRTEAFDHSKKRTRDSYGVEIEKMSICRRVQTVEAALRDLDDSTVCGLTTLNGENPTCQPLDLIATFTGSGVTFKWLPGCRAGSKFQINRNGNTQIGSDFVRTVEDPEGPVSAAEKRAFCSEYIEPGAVVLDFDQELFSARVGEEIEYCVRSIVDTEFGEVASNWRCTTLRIPFYADNEIQVEAGGSPLPGVVLDAALCAQEDASCFDSSGQTTWLHTIPDGGYTMSYAMYNTDPDFVAFDAEATGGSVERCSASNGQVVEGEADFTMLFDEREGLAWYRSTPGCLLKIANYTAPPDDLPSFTVVDGGAVQQLSGFIGLSLHLVTQRSPSWEYMAINCRETCGITGEKDKSGPAAKFAESQVPNVRSRQFCERYAYRCPALVGDVVLTDAEQGALILGSDTEESTSVVCSPYEGTYAYFDEDGQSGAGYKCCDGSVPTGWDNCERHFTVCDQGDVDRQVSSVPDVPQKELRVFVESGAPIFADSQDRDEEDLPWLYFYTGPEDSASSTEVSLVNPAMAKLGDEVSISSSPIQVVNARVTRTEDFYFGRTDNGGVWAKALLGPDGPSSNLRNIFVFPFVASEFLDETGAHVATAFHKFSAQGAQTLEPGGVVLPVRTSQGDVGILSDETAVVVPVHVSHPEVPESACGVVHILMCAYTSTGLEAGCAKTDQTGFAFIQVPIGLDITIRNGCPNPQLDAAENSEQCAGDDEIKLGREIVQTAEREPDVLVSSADAARGVEQAFVEVSSRLLETRAGAGRFRTVDGSNSVDGYLTVQPYRQLVRNGIYVKLTSTNRTECDFIVPLSEMVQTSESDVALNKRFMTPLPMDEGYVAQVYHEDDDILASLDSEDAKAGALAVTSFINSLPSTAIAEDDPEPAVEVLYRKPATIEAELNFRTPEAPIPLVGLDNCVNARDETIFTAANSAVSPETRLEVTFSVREEYNAFEVELAGDLLFVPGTLITQDNLAAFPEAREFVGGNLAGESDAILNNVCSGNSGCTIPNALDTACEEVTDVCLLHGTLYQMAIVQLGLPERFAPYTKDIVARFVPDIDDVPSETQQEMLSTDNVIWKVVVTGDIPLTLNQAIKLPEYIPFVILRRPPGDESVTTWHKDTSIDVQVAIADEFGAGAFFDGKAGLARHSTVSQTVGAVAAPGGAGAQFTLKVKMLEEEGWKGATTGHEGQISGIAIDGDMVSLTASASYSTPTGIYGDFADLLVTPSLSIRTITVLPIAFNLTSDATFCGGFELNEASKWQLLDGAAAGHPDCAGATSQGEQDACALSKALEAYLDSAERSELTIEDGETDQDLKDRLRRDYAKKAIADTSWNALSIHSVWDVLFMRLPQLQERCLEEHSRIMCFASDADVLSDFDALGEEYEDFKWCKPIVDSSGSPECIRFQAFGDADDDGDTELLALARLEATLEGIQGWKQAVDLNEALKARAQPVRAGELVQSPLLTGRESEQLLPAAEQQIQEDMETRTQKDVLDRLKLANPAGVTRNGFQGKHDGITGTQEMQAEASILAFTGGGSKTEYEYSSAASQKLVLRREGYYNGRFSLGTDFFIALGSVTGFAADFEAGPIFHEDDQQTSEETRRQKTTVSFTLQDGQDLDAYDVRVLTDPIYGTPVFDLVAGRSRCPHEPGTDPREQWDFRFSDGPDLLDAKFEPNKKVRVVSRPVGADLGTPASFAVDLFNISPYDDYIVPYIRINSESDSDLEGRTYYGIYGVRMESDFTMETGTYEMPLLPGGESNHWRVDMFPSSDDERDFAERAARMLEEGKTDAAGREHPGALYCNVEITIFSTCEWREVPKRGSVRTDDMDFCNEFDILKGEFPSTVLCHDEVLPEIFDGRDDTPQFALEVDLHRSILISCLSMDNTRDLCDPSSYTDDLGPPCAGMDSTGW